MAIKRLLLLVIRSLRVVLGAGRRLTPGAHQYSRRGVSPNPF